MALIQYSALVNSMSGKLNGSVASFNKGGSYLRNKGTVTNPNTLAQVNIRSRFGSIAGAWRGLTDAQRLSWTGLASESPYTNRFGETKFLSGFGLFQQRNLNLAMVGESILANAPTDEPVLSHHVGSVIVDSTGLVDFSVVIDDGLDNWLPLIDATPKISAGITYIKNKIRFMSLATTLGVPVASMSANNYEAVFGSISTGDVVGVGLYFINRVTGQSTVEYLTTVTVTV